MRLIDSILRSRFDLFNWKTTASIKKSAPPQLRHQYCSLPQEFKFESRIHNTGRIRQLLNTTNMQYRPTPVVLLLLFSFLTMGILAIPTAHARQEEQLSAGVPIDVLQKAMRYVKQHNYGDSEGNASQVLQRLESGDIHSLYKVAQAMNEMNNKDDRLASIEIWHALADVGTDGGGGGGHLLSQVALGFAYSENDKATAVTYFVHAGEAGPHQAALFNAGRLLADPELEDFVKALAYLRGAYSVAETHPKYSTAHVTEASKVAYERLSEQLMTLVIESTSAKGSILSIQMVADMFLYANLNDFPMDKSKEEKNWGRAMQSLQAQKWEMALMEFEKLEKNSKDKLSTLQIALLHILKQYCKSASGINLSDEL